MKARIRYIDIAKGIGIISVIIGHTIPESVNIIYSFHMPLFFILSGYFFGFSGPKNCLTKSIKRLVIPYVIAICCVIAFYLLKSFFDGNTSWVRWIQAGIYGSGWDYDQPMYIPGVGGIWFLLALFIAMNMLNSLQQFPEYIRLVFVCALGYWGWYTYALFPLPWEIQNGCLGLVFLYIGYLFKQYEVLSKKDSLLYIFALLVWVFALWKQFAFVSMVNCSIRLINIITATCGVIVCVGGSKFIDNKISILGKILAWIGKRTEIILIVHIFELHTGIIQDSINGVIGKNKVYFILVVRLLWAGVFALLIPLMKRRGKHLISQFNKIAEKE